MSSIETKRKIASDVLDLLAKYPDSHQLIVSLVHSLTGVDQEQSRIVTKSSSKVEPPKAAPTKPEKKKTSSSDQDENGFKSDEIIDPRSITGPKGQCNLVQALLTTKVKRQEGALAPRMDHKSIRARASSARKKLRDALKIYKESDSSDPDHVDKIRDLVNKTKSFRLVFGDAYKANSSVNIGADLSKNFPSPAEWGHLVDALKESEFYEDEETHYWISLGSDRAPDPPRNPFASGD
jgi:hypothetical protein